MLTKSDLIEVMNQYIAPLYQIIGAMVAALVIAAAVIFVIKPFVKRL